MWGSESETRPDDRGARTSRNQAGSSKGPGLIGFQPRNPAAQPTATADGSNNLANSAMFGNTAKARVPIRDVKSQVTVGPQGGGSVAGGKGQGRNARRRCGVAQLVACGTHADVVFDFREDPDELPETILVVQPVLKPLPPV